MYLDGKDGKTARRKSQQKKIKVFCERKKKVVAFFANFFVF
jgi:hypothetical protein